MVARKLLGTATGPMRDYTGLNLTRGRDNRTTSRWVVWYNQFNVTRKRPRGQLSYITRTNQYPHETLRVKRVQNRRKHDMCTWRLLQYIP